MPTEARGFALYVGVSESTARANGLEIDDLIEALRNRVTDLVPTAESHAVAVLPPEPEPARAPELASGAVIDLARFRVLVDGSAIHLTYKEFALLQALVRSDGGPLSRQDLRSVLAGSRASGISDRAVDVHIRRVRAKLGDYADLIGTVHGQGLPLRRRQQHDRGVERNAVARRGVRLSARRARALSPLPHRARHDSRRPSTATARSR